MMGPIISPPSRSCQPTDAAFTDHMAHERRLLGHIDLDKHNALEAILRSWLSHH